MNSGHAEKAKALLVNYFEAIAKKAGMKWDRDYTIEIGDAIDHIIEAAAERAIELTEPDR